MGRLLQTPMASLQGWQELTLGAALAVQGGHMAGEWVTTLPVPLTGEAQLHTPLSSVYLWLTSSDFP